MQLPLAELDTAFGRCVIVQLADPELAQALALLPPAERAAAAALSPLRLRDHVAGRTALHVALTALALEHAGTPILPDDRGAPILPRGWVGSVSHKGRRDGPGMAAALVAPDAGARVGVDLERAQPPRVDIAPRVLTPRELVACADRGAAVTLRFAIKEAIYKAIDPYVRRYVGFHEVELEVGDDGSCTVTSALPLAIAAAWREHAGHWLATASASRAG